MSDASQDASPKYNPDSHDYTASRNKKGFGSSFRITVPPYVVSGIAQLVASQRIPQYRTSHDVHRNALVHQLVRDSEYLKGDQELSRIAKLLIIESEVHQIEVARQAVTTILG